MLTIDWKERLNKDTVDYLEHKLPKNDYDFEIIFNAYPERVNGKIPPEVIVHVASAIIQRLGKNHEKYLPFYKHLWDKKGAYGKTAFITMMSKVAGKKPATYLPVLEAALLNAPAADLSVLLEKVLLPLLRKQPEKYLPQVYQWSKHPKQLIRQQMINLLVKLLKKNPELSAEVLEHFVHQWMQPLGEELPHHLTLLKAVAKLDYELYLKVWRENGHSRDPQTVEILCGSLLTYHPEIEAIVENWTKSGNARVKKAATIAWRMLQKKKG